METSYYATKLRQGNAFERFVAEQLARDGIEVGLYTTQEEQLTIGESRMGLEIKFDDRLAHTGNVYIETDEKRREGNATWVRSGIYRDDNSILYGVGNNQEFYIFGKYTLQRVHQVFIRKLAPNIGPGDYKERTIATSKGFTLARYLAKSWAEREYRADSNGNWIIARAVSSSFRIDDLIKRGK